VGDRRKDRVVLLAPRDEDTLLLAGLFATAGYALSTVFDAPTVLAMCTQSAPDAVIVDLDTPEVDGVEVVAKLRAVEGCAGMRIVAIPSTAATRVTDDALLGASFDAVVGRPATVTKLIDALGTQTR
jgi:two-component system, cell cycle response regulator DivK